MFVVAGTNGVVLTGDLFNLYVFMEITAIASYALVAFGGEDLKISKRRSNTRCSAVCPLP